MLKIENLNFSYEEQKILDDINIAIGKKEFIGIIGPNGSGKSTLLKNISKHLNADSGFIYLNNELLNEIELNRLARIMSVVPQETAVNYSFSVYDLVMMGRNPYQDRWGRVTTEDSEEVRKALELTDTWKFRDKKINQLSGGERQRVIIARALAQQPELLLLDEPTASLDINYQQEVFDILSYLNEELGLTIIVVSHDLNLSSQYCDELILLKNGSIYKVGVVSEVLTEENIKAVYHTEVSIQENPMTGRPYVVMKPGRSRKESRPERDSEKEKVSEAESKTSSKIHLICGGGSGRELMRKLASSGYKLSCGVLNQGDSDWETAVDLNIEMVEIPPFSPIDADSERKNFFLAVEADYVILTDTPFGHGNLENLKVLLDLKESIIILFEGLPIAERDFTGGMASEYWQELIIKENVISINTEKELYSLLNS